MIKVEVVKSGDITEIFFETRNSTDVFLADLDTIYAALLSGKPVDAGYVGSIRFSIKYKMPEEKAST